MNLTAIGLEAEPLAGNLENDRVYLDDLNDCLRMTQRTPHRRVASAETNVQHRPQIRLIEIREVKTALATGKRLPKVESVTVKKHASLTRVTEPQKPSRICPVDDDLAVRRTNRRQTTTRHLVLIRAIR